MEEAPGRAEDLVGRPPTILGKVPDVMEDTGFKLDLKGGRMGCFETPICDIEDEFLRLGACLFFNLVSVSNFLFLLISSSVYQISMSIQVLRFSGAKLP
jgi:hypothetical protein